jgi:hypothetical protein
VEEAQIAGQLHRRPYRCTSWESSAGAARFRFVAAARSRRQPMLCRVFTIRWALSLLLRLAVDEAYRSA